MKKIIKKIHLWLSIPFGIIIMLLCLSGAVLVFETEIKEITDRKTYFVEEVKDNPLPLPELMAIVKQNLPDSVSISSVSIPADADRNYRVGMEGGGRNSITVDPYTGEIRGKIQPYEKGTFFSFARRLHRWFLFDYKRGEFSWGKTITGVSTLMFVFILISGLIVWIPKTLKALKRRLSIKVKKGTFRFNYDLHLAGGFYAFLFLLLFCLTGLTWSFNWYRDGVYKLFGAEIIQQAPPTTNANTNEAAEVSGRNNRGSGRPSGNEQNKSENSAERPREKPVGGESGDNHHLQRENSDENERQNRRGRPSDAEKGDSEYRGERRGGNKPSVEEGSYNRAENGRGEGGEGRRRGGNRSGRGDGRSNYINWEVCAAVVAELRQQNPDFLSISVQRESASVSNNRYGNTRASDRYTFNPHSGEITGSELAKDANRASKLRGWLYALHVGSWGGTFTKLLSFIACLIGAALPITGYYMYIKKNTKKKERPKS